MTPDVYFRVIFGLVAVIGLIGVDAFLARKIGLGTAPSFGGRKRRLAITETLPLDARRRLVIVRCDDREHLIILGAQSETIIGKDFEVATMSDETPAMVQRNPFAELRHAFGGQRADQDKIDRTAA